MAANHQDPELLVRAGAALAGHLDGRVAEADALARTLAPDGPGAGVRYARYGASLATAESHHAYQARFDDPQAFLLLLAHADPGALELGLELVSRLDPEAVVEPASWLLTRRPWNGLGAALGRALGRTASERGFRLLVDHPDAPYLRAGLATQGWPVGVEEARALTRAVDWSVEVEPRLRDQTLPLFGYRLNHDPLVFPEVVALLDGPSGHLWASHALSRLDAGRAVLFARLAQAPPASPLAFAERLAVRLLLEQDPTTAVSALGGEQALAEPGGRPRLAALLDALRGDTWTRGGRGGWLTADPAIPRLCAGLKRDPDRALGSLARDLLATLPASARPKVPRTPPTPRPLPPPPDAALLARTTSLGADLDRLVAHLRADGYRFAAPRSARCAPRAKDLAALARLERAVAVPPALAAFWRVIGGVDLRGEHPDWPVRGWLGFPGAREPVWVTDPLVVAPAAEVVADALEAGSEPPILLRFAPDALGKAGFSAGALGVWVPHEAADPPLDGADGTFLEHLDRAVAWRGFPGFAELPARPEPWLARLRAAVGH